MRLAYTKDEFDCLKERCPNKDKSIPSLHGNPPLIGGIICRNCCDYFVERNKDLKYIICSYNTVLLDEGLFTI
jgi:hypothetical protein